MRAETAPSRGGQQLNAARGLFCAVCIPLAGDSEFPWVSSGRSQVRRRVLGTLYISASFLFDRRVPEAGKRPVAAERHPVVRHPL